MGIAIAIDGPAGAGKSTIAKAAAKALSFIYVDTGALYRTVGLYMLRNGVSPDDTKTVEKSLDGLNVEMKYVGGEQRVILNGEDVSGEIRTEAVSMAASKVSAIPAVRSFLFDLQRDIAKKNDVIMDGRDIGTVVLPDAKVKIFLTASAKVRAERRYKELIEKGEKADFDSVLKDIEQRDYNDSHREIAPLKPAEGSITVDTSDLSLNDSINLLISTIKEKL